MITSKSNELIKKCFQIKQKKYSKKEGLCLIESIKLVRELSNKGLIDTILVIEDKFSKVNNFSCADIQIISNSIASYLSDAMTTDGVFGICRIPTTSNINYNRCLVLDKIQDPTNLGAIIRSACAFGYNTIYAIDSVYPYSFKSIRSSMGHIFNINYIETNLQSLLDIKRDKNINFYVADMDGELVDKICLSEESNLAIIIGNEGQGVSSSFMENSTTKIMIPMTRNLESLNASVSGAIIMSYIHSKIK